MERQNNFEKFSEFNHNPTELKMADYSDSQSQVNCNLTSFELNFYLNKWHELWARLKKTEEIKNMYDAFVNLCQGGKGCRYFQALTLAARYLSSCTTVRIAGMFLDFLSDMSPEEFISFILEKQLKPLFAMNLKMLQQEAAVDSQIKFFKTLTDFTGTFNPDVYGSTALHLAVRFNRKSMVHFILNKTDSAFNQADDLGMTPLKLASHGSHAEIFKLLAKKLKVDPLELAAKQELYSVFRAITAASKLSKLKSFKWPNGRTALHYAVKKKDDLFVNYIFKYSDIDPLQVDDDGMSAFHLAAWKKHYKAFAKIAYNLDSAQLQNAKFGKGRTALHHAVLSKDIQLIKYVLKKTNISPKQADDKGITPISIATSQQDVTAFWMLAEKYAGNLKPRKLHNL